MSDWFVHKPINPSKIILHKIYHFLQMNTTKLCKAWWSVKRTYEQRKAKTLKNIWLPLCSYNCCLQPSCCFRQQTLPLADKVLTYSLARLVRYDLTKLWSDCLLDWPVVVVCPRALCTDPLVKPNKWNVTFCCENNHTFEIVRWEAIADD